MYQVFDCEGRLDEKHESDKVEKSIVASREMSLDLCFALKLKT